MVTCLQKTKSKVAKKRKKDSIKKIKRIRDVKRITAEEVLEESLKDPKFQVYYYRQRIISEIARFIRKSREKTNLTQAKLAKFAKTNQTVIARLESGHDSRTPSLDLLARIAGAFGAKLKVSFESHR